MYFSTLSQYFQKLEKTASRLEMTEILSDLFKNANADEIGKICYLLQGRVLPAYEPLEFGMADKMIVKAISRAFNETENKITEAFKKEGDLGIVVEKLKQEKNNELKNLTVNFVYEKLFELATISGTGSVDKKIYILTTLINDLDQLSCRYIVRIPVAKLRLGFSDMTILDGLSWMLTGDKKGRKIIEAAYNVRPDLGFIATQIKEKGLKGVEKVIPAVGTPILMAKAERLTGGSEIIEKIGKCAIEYKYDGFRVQIHFSKFKIQNSKTKSEKTNLSLFTEAEEEKFVRLYSRNLEDVTKMYPDVVKGVVDQIDADEAIFEGEAIAYDPKSGRYLPFQETVQRKRKYDITQKAIDLPLRLIAFDVLYVDGESLLEKPLTERRKRLEGILKN